MHAHTHTRKTGIGPRSGAAGAAVIGAKITGSIKVDGRAGASMHVPANVHSQEEDLRPERLNGAATRSCFWWHMHIVKKNNCKQ